MRHQDYMVHDGNLIDALSLAEVDKLSRHDKRLYFEWLHEQHRLLRADALAAGDHYDDHYNH